MSPTDHLVQVITQARKDKGLSQTELAEMSGVKQPYISKVEAFRLEPRLVAIIKLTIALDLTLEEVFKDYVGHSG